MAKRKPKVQNRVSAHEPDASSLRVAGVDLDLMAQGVLLEYLEQLRDRLLVEARKSAVNGVVAASDLERAYKHQFAPLSSTCWNVLNLRRVDLIRKQLAGTISTDEEQELHSLQEAADRHMSQVAPRPF